MNQNALAGTACPKCSSEGPFKIETHATATVSDHGVTDVHDFVWGDDDACQCCACEHKGIVMDFHAPKIIVAGG